MTSEVHSATATAVEGFVLDLSVTRQDKAKKLAPLVNDGMLTCDSCGSVFYTGRGEHSDMYVACRAVLLGWKPTGVSKARKVRCGSHLR